MNNYGLFFTRDGNILRLPVNPADLPTERTAENGEYNVLGVGPIIVPRTPGLAVISISSFFPGRPFSGVLTPNGFLPPEVYIRFFETAMKDRAVIRYTPARYHEDGTPYMTGGSEMDVVVTKFTYEERGGETGDFYYDLELTEYRDYTPQKLSIQKAKPGEPAVASTEPSRDIQQGRLYAGCTCVVNGNFYYTSYGDEPHGTAAGRRVKVSRIVDSSRPAPIHITTEDGGGLGWTSASALQVVKS